MNDYLIIVVILCFHFYYGENDKYKQSKSWIKPFVGTKVIISMLSLLKLIIPLPIDSITWQFTWNWKKPLPFCKAKYLLEIGIRPIIINIILLFDIDLIMGTICTLCHFIMFLLLLSLSHHFWQCIIILEHQCEMVCNKSD